MRMLSRCSAESAPRSHLFCTRSTRQPRGDTPRQLDRQELAAVDAGTNRHFSVDVGHVATQSQHLIRHGRTPPGQSRWRSMPTKELAYGFPFEPKEAVRPDGLTFKKAAQAMCSRGTK